MAAFEEVTLEYTTMLLGFHPCLSIHITGVHLMLNRIQAELISLPPDMITCIFQIWLRRLKYYLLANPSGVSSMSPSGVIKSSN